jgi:geranylgeranyl reductase family protein
VAPHAVAILHEMGLSFDLFGKQGRKTYGGLIAGPSGGWFSADPPCEDGKRPESWIVPRVLLDVQIAHAAVAAGAKMREGIAVSGLLFERGAVAGVEASNGNGVERIRARLVIGADGAHSVVAKTLGYATNPPRHLGYALRAYYENVDGLRDDMELYYYSKSMLPGYGWVFPVAERTANVGIGIYVGELKRHPLKLHDILDDFVASVPHVRERFTLAQRVGKAIGWPLPVASSRRPTTFHGAMLCGDAASLIDPLTGEGIWTALVSGRSAARAALEALLLGDVSRGVLQGHEREWRSITGGYLAAGRILKNCAKSARLFDLIVRRATENSYYASRAIGYGLGILDRRRALRNLVMRALMNPAFFRLRPAH